MYYIHFEVYGISFKINSIKAGDTASTDVTDPPRQSMLNTLYLSKLLESEGPPIGMRALGSLETIYTTSPLDDILTQLIFCILLFIESNLISLTDILPSLKSWVNLFVRDAIKLSCVLESFVDM